MDRLKVLFISYVDFTTAYSGSRLRPRKMLAAFEQRGCDVKTLTGDQTDRDRRKKVAEIRRSLKENKYDLCYIESPVYPILKSCDRRLIRKIHEAGIPIGYFYRDFYRKFPHTVSSDKSLSRILKDKVLDLLQRKTDRVLKNCDIVYLPSEESKELFPYHDMRALPTGGENLLPQSEKQLQHTCIYVGGITGQYDGKLLLDSFGELVKRDDRYKLILVCRPEEWEKFDHPLKREKWISVHHASGDDLAELYSQAQIALVIHKDDAYNRYAIPVKTFEYMSYGLPIVSVRIQALAEFISREGAGVVVDHDPQKMADVIQMITKSQAEYDSYAASVKEALLSRNLWKHRVDTVVHDLKSMRD